MSNMVKSIVFALVTAVVCSLLLTAASAGLKGFQRENVEVDQKKNILRAVGLIQEETPYTKAAIKQIYADNIQAFHVSHNGAIVDRNAPVKNTLPIYVYVKNDQIESYIIPINSSGLWGRILGYLALENDGSTIAGFTVYKHSETPGLGGEIEKRWFQKNFKGKKILDRHGNFVSISIAKGALSPSFPKEKRPNYVDGISGATLTGKYLTAGLKSALRTYEPVSIKFRTKQMLRWKGHQETK
jgi:Na+-transporting NADH:ubiquinone oxidoreductase subunit C